MTSTIEKQIIAIIEQNRISSTEVADALNKKGVIHGLMPVNSGKHITGKVKYVYAFDESNWPLHEQVQELEEDVVLFVDAFNCHNKAVFGDLVAKYLILYKRVKAIVVNGLLRDIPNLKKHGYPIWYLGATPLGCFNIPVVLDKETEQKIKQKREYLENGILTCDDSGCTLIEKELINEDILKRLELIELQEDIWFFCIDTLKWSTYETVCLKNYLSNPDVLPPILKEKVKQIPFKG
jgi:4-hydroxy-4-methyl-2-oxoglutarate aldolase